MKQLRILATIAIVILFAACNKDEVIPSGHEQAKAIIQSQYPSRAVTEDQAKDFAQKVYNAIIKTKTPETRMFNSEATNPFIMKDLFVSNILPIKKDGVNVLYVINFGTSGGYMVISADQSTKWALLAFCEKGHIDRLEDLDPHSTFALWLQEKSNDIYQSLQKSVQVSELSSELWKSLGEDAEKDTKVEIEFVGKDEFRVEAPVTRGTHKDSWGLANVGVYSFIRECVWGQGIGYNADAKVPNALAGCPAVAIGTLCRTIYYPSKYPYSEMPIKVLTTQSNPVSKMLRDIADHIPNYNWSSRGSGAKPGDILTGLRKLGFSNAQYQSYDFNLAYNQIKNNYPILLAGYQPNSAHIWVCDGYWEQRWKVTKKFLWWKVKTWYEYSDMFYMNWGWDGNSNGWIDQAEWPRFGNGRIMYYNLHR